MAIYRSKHTNQYLILSNKVAQDGSISMKASGLLHYMLSLPSDWKFNIQHLANHFVKDGKTAIESGLKELEEAGYLVRKVHHSKSGRFDGSDWYVYDRKVTNRNNDKSKNEQDQENHTSDKKSSNKSSKYTQEAKGVVDMLNREAGKHFRYSKSSMRKIRARLKDGYNAKDFAYVIKNKVADWKDGNMDKYLRPTTLFTDEHMNDYLSEKQIFKLSSQSSHDRSDDQVTGKKMQSDDENNLNEVLQSIE